jgi:putative transposase
MPFQETCAVDEKARFCVACEQGDETMSELCRRFGISRKTGYQVWKRWQGEGAPGLAERSHAPVNCPHRLDGDREAAVLAVRRQHASWGPKKIKAYLERRQPTLIWPAASTIGEALDRHGLTVPRKRRRHVLPRNRPFAACCAANDLWSMDFKGWFRTLDGTRIDPFTLQDQQSRYLLRLTPVERTDGAHVQAVLEAAFREFGLPKAIRSDNGPPFGSTGLGGLSSLSVWLLKLGVMPDHTDPASPQQNGRLERMHRDLKAETAKPPAASARAQALRFRAFRQTYNEERPHEALGLETPASHYAASPRPWTGRLRSPDYAGQTTVRRVRSNGEIRWRGGLVYLSTALIGEPVSIEEAGQGRWRVRYGPIELGKINQAGKIETPRGGGTTGRRSRDAFRATASPETAESVTHHAG